MNDDDPYKPLSDAVKRFQDAFILPILKLIIEKIEEKENDSRTK